MRCAWYFSLPAVSPGPGFELHTPAHYRYIRHQAFAWMRAEAVERGYDSIGSCASYYTAAWSGIAWRRARWWRGAML
ncbi:hypothetical protein [Stenotrophomonas maltophilia]|uniref:hypothetical protein n=2 Tax=Stenotrophomonas TaxID=40323 RepID=UPI0007F8F539|nr:hypothetical protein [Stenotrophomonas maltophilia]OBU64143.1 hypothetical protein A9J40_16125 [Stenotrophomonas maltophilia]